MNGKGKTKIPMWISIFGIVVNSILNYILIPKYALVGSAIATSFTSLIVMLAMLYYIQKEFGTIVKIKSLLKMMTAGLIMFGASLFFSQGEFIFIIWSLILFLIYLIVLFALGEIGKQDIQYIKNIISRKKKQKEIREELSGNEPSA